MLRKVGYRVLLFVSLVLIVEICIGTGVEGIPSQKNLWTERQPATFKRKISAASVAAAAVSSVKPTKIVGGSFTTIKEYPYQASIRFNGKTACGGTLIGWKRQHVLTAAHCAKDGLDTLDKKDMNVLFGSTNVRVWESTGIIRNVKKITIHPRYNYSWRNGYDIAIFTLDRPVNQIQPARLETIEDFDRTDYDGKTAVAIGWGTMIGYDEIRQENSPTSDRLKLVEVPIISADKCNALYKGTKFESTLDYTQQGITLCTHNLKPEDTCQGDSGGPLLVDGIQVGITSGAVGCANVKFPEHYTRVAPFRPWINEVLAKDN